MNIIYNLRKLSVGKEWKGVGFHVPKIEDKQSRKTQEDYLDNFEEYLQRELRELPKLVSLPLLRFKVSTIFANFKKEKQNEM